MQNKPMGNDTLAFHCPGIGENAVWVYPSLPVSMVSLSWLLWLRNKRKIQRKRKRRLDGHIGEPGYSHCFLPQPGTPPPFGGVTITSWLRAEQDMAEYRTKQNPLVIVKQKERTENQGKPPGNRRSDGGDRSSRVLTQSPPVSEHRPGADSYCWGRRHLGLAMFGTISVLLPSCRTPTSPRGAPTLPTNHPVTNTTHSFTTLNLSALLGAGHTWSLMSLAGPVQQDLGTVGYINHSQIIITLKCQLHTYQHCLF